MKIPLFEQHGIEDAPEVSNALTQNLIPTVPQQSDSQMVMYPTPGLTEFTLFGTSGSIRGAIKYNNKYYCVYYNTLYEVASTGATTSLGTINTSTGRVTMAHNGANYGQQIMIADGSDLWCYDDSAGTLTEVTLFNDGATSFTKSPTHVVFMDGFFLINDPANSGRFYKSDGYDGQHNSGWNTLNFATAERSPDELKAIVASDKILFLLGDTTTEMWYNDGSSGVPYVPMQSGFTQWGCAAPYSAIEISGVVLWLTKNDEGEGLVVKSVGGAPEVVSTQAIASEIQDISDLTDAYAWSYQHKQNTYYVLTFPTGQKTFVYNLNTGKWHTWKTESTGYHKSANHVYVYGKHLIGDPDTGKVYYLDWRIYTDNAERIVRKRRTGPIASDAPVVH